METSFYQQIFSDFFGKTVTVKEVRSLSGGCINDAVKIVLPEGIFCVKTNKASLYPSMFEKEAQCLRELHNTNSIEVPEPLKVGEKEGIQYIIMSFIESSVRVKNFWEDFGRSLASLHSHTTDRFGLNFDNYIGSLPQQNQWKEHGVQFFIENRLQPQLQMASEKGLLDKEIQTAFEKLFVKLPDLLPEEQPCLLHGDLWSGNFIVGKSGKVVLIDPAVYYGAAEAELAFTTLFGGFEDEFYSAYSEVHKLEKGYEKRFDLYNLYPLLVHVNLFGKSYLSGIRNILLAYS